MINKVFNLLSLITLQARARVLRFQCYGMMMTGNNEWHHNTYISKLKLMFQRYAKPHTQTQTQTQAQWNRERDLNCIKANNSFDIPIWVRYLAILWKFITPHIGSIGWLAKSIVVAGFLLFISKSYNLSVRKIPFIRRQWINWCWKVRKMCTCFRIIWSNQFNEKTNNNKNSRLSSTKTIRKYANKA